MKQERSNSWTKKGFLDILNKVAKAYFGVHPQEDIIDIQAINNTVVIKIGLKRPQRKG